MKIQINKLIGDEMVFSVRHRILNMILLFSTALAIFNGIFNYIMDLGLIVIVLSVAGGIMAGGLYYLSLRRRQYLYSVLLLVCFYILIFLPLIWIFGGGIFGSTTYLIFTISIMSTALFTGKNRIGMLLLIIGITVLLCVVEYQHPTWIIGYNSRFRQFVDISFSIIMNLVFNTAFIALILNFYITEQNRCRRYLEQLERHEMELKFQSDLRCINEKLAQEIKERRQIESSLIQSEQLFAKTFAASPIPMAILAADSQKFLDINNSFAEVFDCLPPEVVQQTAASVIGCAEMAVHLAQVIDGKTGIYNIDITFYTKLGVKRMGLLSVERAELNGELCLLLAINDITERVQIYNEMARLDRLNLVGEMAASIGHEVRNPLTTVRGFLQLFQRSETVEVKQQYFEIMIEELDRANTIISEFLSLAKNKRIELVKRNLNEIITKLQPLLQADALSAGKSLLLELGNIPEVLLDENEIRQYILNLVRNGLEAAPAKGRVLIRTYQEGGYTILAIQDNGSGIPLEVMNKFGTPFLTTKETGTGLGIPICYRIAERHHAKIEINTGADGTTLMLKFNSQC